jgi:hypothetical protein
MALEKQLKSMPFTEGPDTKTDPILSAKPSRVENYVIRGGTLKKRWGTSTLSTTTDIGSTLSTGELVFAFDSELVRINGSTAYSLSSASNRWTTKPGGGLTATHVRRPLVRNSHPIYDADHASANGVTVIAWAESYTFNVQDLGIHVQVYDEATGDIFQTVNMAGLGLSSTANAKGCRCVVLGNKILVFYTNAGSGIGVVVVDTTSPSTTPTVATGIATPSVTTSSAFDAYAAPGGAYAVLAYITGVGGARHVSVKAIDATGAVKASPAATDLGLVGDPTNSQSVALRIDTNGIAYAVSYGSMAYFLSFNASTFATVTTWTAITTNTTQARVAMAEATAGQITVFLSDAGTSATAFASSAVINSAGVVTAWALIPGTGGVGIQGDGFLVNGSAACLVMTGQTSSGAISLQPTYWAITTSGSVVAKILPGTAANNNSATTRVSRAFTTPKGAQALVVFERGRLNYTSQAGTVIDKTPIGLTRVDLLPVRASLLPVIRIGGETYIGGSRPSIYDGQEWTDAGFNQFPETVTAAAAAGGVLTAGTYQYRVLYSWVNAQGALQRSAPSPAVSVTVTVNQKVTLTIPTMRLSNRDTTAVNRVQIEVYRTEANGTNFYRVSKVDSPQANDQTAATLSFADDSTLNVPDSSLISNELLYTTGGVYDNIAPPAYTAACAHKNRLVMVGLEDPYEWRSSCVAIRGEMLRFNEAWGGRVPAERGKLVGCASLDNNLILFAERGAYVVLGDGPDLLGNNAWQPPQPITAVTAGPLSAQSIVSTPAGVLFQNAQGFQLLDRSLNVQFIGADVDAYAGYAVRCAMVRPEVSQVWMHMDQGSDMVGAAVGGELNTSNGGVCLVFDYVYGQWSVLTNYGAQSAAYYQGKYCRMRSDGTCFQEQPGTYRDSGVYVPGTFETGWIKLAGLQGFQRVFEAGLLGAYGGSGNDFVLTWSIGYDYATTYDSTYTLTYNTAGIFANGEPFQVQRQMPRQKCQAIRFKFTDSPSGNGQGMALTDLTLVVGVKGGSNRLPYSKTM